MALLGDIGVVSSEEGFKDYKMFVEHVSTKFEFVLVITGNHSHTLTLTHSHTHSLTLTHTHSNSCLPSQATTSTTPTVPLP
jgi:hypothetical protein